MSATLSPAAAGVTDEPGQEVETATGRTAILPAPPPMNARETALSRASRIAFRYGNRSFMVPLHRAGLSAWLGNPLTGWQLLLITKGRRSGLPRPTPLGYLVADGAAWVLAGYGPSTLWYRNLLEDPRVEVLMPARPPFAATADVVDEPEARARIVPPLVRSMPLPGSMIGANVWTASDARILELTAWVPLVRLRPDGPPLIVGPDDPGGSGWIWRQALVALLCWLAIASRRRPRIR